MLARNNFGRPGTRLPLSLFVLCWSHAQSHLWGRMGHAPAEIQTSLWNGPGCGQNLYGTAETVENVAYIRTATVLWHTQDNALTMLLEFTGTAIRHTAAETDVVMHVHAHVHTHTYTSTQRTH
jgi:hypothetical protein